MGWYELVVDNAPLIIGICFIVCGIIYVYLSGRTND